MRYWFVFWLAGFSSTYSTYNSLDDCKEAQKQFYANTISQQYQGPFAWLVNLWADPLPSSSCLPFPKAPKPPTPPAPQLSTVPPPTKKPTP